MRLQRTDKSRLTQWWFTVDRQLLALILLLIAAGVLLSLVASPAIALKRDVESFYIFKRHVVFAGLAILTLLAVSFLSAAAVRRLALIMALTAVPAMALVLWIAPEINGAQRWLTYGGWQIQPSEFAKPALVVLFAWALADQRRHADMPALPLVTALIAAAMGLLVLQPDVGQTVLLAAVCMALYFLAGRPLWHLGAMLTLAVVLGFIAYHSMDHFRSRLDRFVDRTAGDTFQMDKAQAAFVRGGWLGRGPGEGTIKTSLPDAHTDYILAVVAEEYGVVACIGLLLMFGLVLVRVVRHFWLEDDAEIRFMAMGLALLLGLQALVNIGVNAGLLPAKGMTLPFISYGGSSLLGSGIAMGMLLALTRRQRPVRRERGIVLVAATPR